MNPQVFKALNVGFLRLCVCLYCCVHAGSEDNTEELALCCHFYMGSRIELKPPGF